MPGARAAGLYRLTLQVTRPYLRGYAAVLLCSHELAGLLILAVTFVRPEIGAVGLLAAVTARLTAQHLGYADAEQPPEIYNALLIGLAMAYIWKITALLVAIVVVTAVVSTLATHVLAGWLWRLNRLPVLSLPFVLAVWAFMLASRDVEVLALAAHAPFAAFEPAWLNDFFTALGWFLFTPHPVAGLTMFIALLVSSRYLALLCICGYLVGAVIIAVLGSSAPIGMVGYNFMLATMAVGGLFTFPDRVSFAWGLFAAVIATLLAMALSAPLANLHLPVVVAPFLLATYLLLAGLAARPRIGSPYLLLEAPALPERSLVAARLARARLGEPGSHPVLVPFLGAWQVSQGIDGRHTHRGPWRDAFDFVVLDEKASSFREQGTRLADYYAFGAPVLAPVSGTVWKADDRMPDNRPGEVDVRAGRNFGNYLMLRTADGVFVLLGHLKQGSLSTRPGEWVEAGQVVAACGNSGRSTQPHVHLQVQSLDDIEAPTRPLHLRSVTVRGDRGATGPFMLSARPREGETVTAAVRDSRFAEAMHFPVGRIMTFESSSGIRQKLTVELTLFGQFRLASASGASAAFDERSDVLAFYDRRGPPDRCLDALLLAVGLTPFSSAAHSWHDAPPVGPASLPFATWLTVLLLRPFGAAFESRYRREWDAARQIWYQRGAHRLALLPGHSIEVASEAILDPVFGVREIRVSNGAKQRRYVLVDTGSVGDVGVSDPANRGFADRLRPRKMG